MVVQYAWIKYNRIRSLSKQAKGRKTGDNMKMKTTEKMGHGKMKNGRAGTAGTGTKKRSMIRWGIAGFLVMGLLSGCSGTGEMEAQNQELKSRVESLSAE